MYWYWGWEALPSGGDLIHSYAGNALEVPLTVNRSYSIPAWVDEHTLVIASSYSGNTEETLSMLGQAMTRTHQIVCVTAGGQLNRLALKHNWPLIVLPDGLPPRAALGYSLTALLQLGQAAGFLNVEQEDVEETGMLLVDQAGQWKMEKDPLPRTIANLLYNRLPVIYAGSGLLESVNLRWRCQLQENAKSPAVGHLFPELNHNEIVGWDGPESILSSMGVVVLRDQEDHPQIKRRIDITSHLLRSRAGSWIEVESKGRGRLARMMSLVQLGDWVSIELAERYGVDPIPIPLITHLKEALAN